MILDGLDEDWLSTAEASRYRTWHLSHIPESSNTCIMTINTAEFQESPPRSQVKPLPLDVASSFVNIAYALRHKYDFMRVHMPSPEMDWLQRVLPWYKLPVLRHLAHLHYTYVVYMDADAWIQQPEMPLPSALPSFFANSDAVLFAPKDIPGYGVFNAGVMMFRTQHSAFLILIQQWWDAPQRYEDDTIYRNICHNRNFPAEQGCLTALYNSSDCARFMEVGQEQWIYVDSQATSETFIRHITSGYPPDDRIRGPNYQAARDFAYFVHMQIKALKHGSPVPFNY